MLIVGLLVTRSGRRFCLFPSFPRAGFGLKDQFNPRDVSVPVAVDAKVRQPLAIERFGEEPSRLPTVAWP